jgi:hypothetical protein
LSYTEKEMTRQKEGTETGGNQTVPPGIVLCPPVTVDDLKADTEYDPEGAEEFVALIRALRQEASHPDAL